MQLVLLGHGMSQDLERAEGEIEWPNKSTHDYDMMMMDTQKLYLAYQLKQLDARAAAKALEAVVAQKDKNENKAAPLLEDENDLGLESESDDSILGMPDDLDDSDADEDDIDRVAALAKSLARASVKGGGSSRNSRGASPAPGSSNGKGGANGVIDTSGMVLVKTKQLQLPKKVRPWPAGPPAEDRAPGAAANGEWR